MIFTPLASDNFNRADNNDLGASWDAGYTGYFTLEIVGNVCAAEFANEGDTCIETYNAFSLPNNQYAEVTIVDWGGETLGGVLLRASAPTSLDGYHMNASSFTGGTVNGINIDKFAAGVWTTIADDVVSQWPVNDVLKGAALGTGLFMFQNGVEILSGTDSDFSAGRAGIIGLWFSSVNNIPKFNDLVMGEVEADSAFQAAWARRSNIVLMPVVGIH